MFYTPAKKIDYRLAERRLKLWLKEQGLRMLEAKECAYWDLSSRPFWSVWALIVGEGTYETWGLHIHDDGEILLATKLEWTEDAY